MTQPPHAYLGRPAHKEPPAHAPNAALLIDFDNVTMAIRSDLQTELKRLLQSEIIRGKVAVQRAYADWRRYQQYVVPLAESSIDLIFAPAYGSNKKNATDIRLAIDALELVFTRPEIGTFILLSGDSDFSALVLKLKEYGKYVIGVGIRESSSDLLIQNCDEYYSYNELAGFTKESDVTHERHDPWELVIEAVKQMTAHNDVMRSDRLKQVMQEIDPGFDEKDVGYSRFSKFVLEAAHKGLINLTKLDNGQYEIGLGPGVPGAAAQPSLAMRAREPHEERAAGARGGRRVEGRGRRGGGDAEVIDLSKEHDGADEVAATVAPDEVAAELPDESMLVGEAPTDVAPAAAAPVGGVPARSGRFRRGSRGPRVTPPDIPKIGVVEVDPNFKPRIELVPAKPAPPVTSAPARESEGASRERGERGERGDRGRRGGGRGSASSGRDREPGEREPGERGGRRRGGRGRGGRGRGRGAEQPGTTGSGFDRLESRDEPRATPPPRAVSSPPPRPPASPPDDPTPEGGAEGESFWSKVKRGLTGGT